MLEKWIVVYKDKSIVEGQSKEEFEALEPNGVQVLLLLFNDGTRQSLSGFDYYYFVEKDILGGTNDASHLLRRFQNVKFGEMLSVQTHREIEELVDRLGNEHHKKHHG